MDIRDDSKTIFDEAIELSTYSNSKAGVLSYVGIFEKLWNQIELYQQVKEANERLKLHDKMQQEFINVAASSTTKPHTTNTQYGLCKGVGRKVFNIISYGTMNKTIKQKITPFLWFDHHAEEAAKFYASIFKNSKIIDITHYGKSAADAYSSIHEKSSL